MENRVSGPGTLRGASSGTPVGTASDRRPLLESGTRFCALFLGWSVLLLAGCNGSAGIPGLTQSAFPLAGNQTYSGPRMITPRFGHTATILEDGSVLVVGGTDERFLTALDTVELFDQSARVDLTLPTPESVSGDFLDQDIDGDIITLINGGRFYHTASVVENNKVIVIGGTDNIIFGEPEGDSEIFDPLTRSFDNPDLAIDPDDDILVPRARHTADLLPSGKLLITGGQEFEIVVIPGGGFGTQTQRAYTSTEVLEIFDPGTRSFSAAVDNNFLPAELTSPRGRSGHVTTPFAGFDNLIDTGDDLIMVAGGFETLSAQSLAAPTRLGPWLDENTKLSSVDFYFAAGGSVSFAQGLVLPARTNGALALNLGLDRQTTPNGSFGMSNISLIFGGDSDNPGCPTGDPQIAGGTSADASDLIVATYTGFGPANGARFFRSDNELEPGLIPYPSGWQSNWGFENLALADCPNTFNRSHGAGLLMDMVRVRDNQPFVGSVIIVSGGQDQSGPPCGGTLVDQVCNTQNGFQFFDPFFHPGIFEDDNNGDGEPDVFPWQYEEFGTNLNPLGIVGAWLSFDENIPTGQDLTGFVESLPTVAMKEPRVFHTMTRVPGEDGLIGTIDDRVVVIGGSDEYWPGGIGLGEDALANSCEIFVPPDAGGTP